MSRRRGTFLCMNEQASPKIEIKKCFTYVSCEYKLETLSAGFYPGLYVWPQAKGKENCQTKFIENKVTT